MNHSSITVNTAEGLLEGTWTQGSPRKYSSFVEGKMMFRCYIEHGGEINSLKHQFSRRSRWSRTGRRSLKTWTLLSLSGLQWRRRPGKLDELYQEILWVIAELCGHSPASSGESQITSEVSFLCNAKKKKKNWMYWKAVCVFSIWQVLRKRTHTDCSFVLNEKHRCEFDLKNKIKKKKKDLLVVQTSSLWL